MRLKISVLFFCLFVSTCVCAQSTESALEPLYGALDRMLAPLQARPGAPVGLFVSGSFVEDDGDQTPFDAQFLRAGNADVGVRVAWDNKVLRLARTTQTCALHVPHEEVLIVGRGEMGEEDAFTYDNTFAYLQKTSPRLAAMVEMARYMNSRAVVQMLLALDATIVPLPPENKRFRYRVSFNGLSTVVSFEPDEDALRLDIKENGWSATVECSLNWGPLTLAVPALDEAMPVLVPRAELERSLVHGLVRALEITYDRHHGGGPALGVFEGEHGRMTVTEHERLVYLEGNAYEVGLQHGRFLAESVRKNVDATLYLVGLYYSVERNRWFLDEIRGATERLDRFTPPEYIEEMRGVAEGSGLTFEEIHLANYFPALFHCSGFAVKGEATLGGTLYHGRILDYMTGLGFEENHALLAVRKDGAIPFVNIGYAGIVGSVSGMNGEKVALGEMGGRGEGLWDGVSMPILMRMALERAETLEDAKNIFSSNPRTCEYYYVFSDGKDQSAVGVAATPEKIEFVGFGEPHEELPTPIDDTVLLSAGKRYGRLCERVRENYGRIDAEKAIELMDDGVAMGGSNLHSVLFVPELLELWVANAGKGKPAYDNPWQHYTWDELFPQKVQP